MLIIFAYNILILIGRSERGGHSSHVVYNVVYIGWLAGSDLETSNTAGGFKF